MSGIDCSWLQPPARLLLPGDEVHVWRASLDQPVALLHKFCQLLSTDERARAARFHFETDRKHFITGRALFRLILSRYLSLEPDQLQFCYGPYGKPSLKSKSGGRTLGINMSHSQGMALYAVAACGKVGVDLEKIHALPNVDGIAQHFFSPSEYAVFRSMPTEQKYEAFFNCWTRKEAYLKACGDGLFRSLDTFSVSLTPGEPARLLSVEGDPRKAAQWSMHTLFPAPNYAAALVVEENNWRLACWHWSD